MQKVLARANRWFLVFERGEGLEDLRGFWAIEDGIIFADLAITEDQDAFSKLRERARRIFNSNARS